ncbi:Cytochrome P450 E-class group I [Penicillium vulpinum]|uniref:Cytochrome P450 E-class group I n=1 Tax=Penicillium vulpinum TaxID=29845 RepID=UPI0025483852|nr:Cytochrome P450 E-class group I [Penicillium vulpinum]KAJ5958643.1 Cytochrome P450 E-class group I [Penicillium vulpinum]
MVELQERIQLRLSCKQVGKEIYQAAESRKLFELPNYSETFHLPFLKAKINEALRLHPGVRCNVPQVFGKNGIK